jgi:hypothetical protein
MTNNHLISNTRNLHLSLGEELGVRSKLTKRQIEVTMFAAGLGKLDDLPGKLFS